MIGRRWSQARPTCTILISPDDENCPSKLTTSHCLVQLTPETPEACYRCPMLIHMDRSKAFSCTVWGRFTYPGGNCIGGEMLKRPRRIAHQILTHAYALDSMRRTHIQYPFFCSLLYTSAESIKFHRFSSPFNDVKDLIWLLRHHQSPRIHDKSRLMPQKRGQH